MEPILGSYSLLLLDGAEHARQRGVLLPPFKRQRLLAAAQAAGAKVIAIGDSGQLPSVQAGGWMREIATRVGAPRLTQVMRQRDVDERRALAHLHDGRSSNYLEWADANERLQVHSEASALPA